MKKYFIYTLMAAVGVFSSCNNDDDIDTTNSIFETSGNSEPNEFDGWLLDNYVYPYNVQVKYRLDDKETDVKYDLVPAKEENAKVLAKIVKFVWFEAYDEIWGINMTRQYAPKLIQFIGNVAYTQSGMILGEAEGGMKVMLYRVNEIDKNDISVDALNEYYFKTMHHEFTHILNQRKPYDPAYERISESGYVGSSWYLVKVADALKKGFISPYAMDRATEDFAEMVSIYVTNDADTWEEKLRTAGSVGRPIIEKKFEIVYNYMIDSWGINLDEVREVVQRRQNQITELDLDIN